jgi:hypothetical protein
MLGRRPKAAFLFLGALAPWLYLIQSSDDSVIQFS